MTKNARRRRLFGLLLLVLTGFFLRAISLDAQSLWRDEVDALRFATAPWAEMVENFTRPGWNGPLYYVFLRIWVMGAGTTEYAMRFFSLVFGVLSIPLVYVLGCRLFGAPVGILSGLVVSISPYIIWYSQEVKMYTEVLALALLAIYSLHRALTGGGQAWWATQIVSTSLAFYSHILAALLVPVQILLALAWWPRLRRHWRGALVSLACLTLPYLPLAVWQAPLALRARDTGFYDYSLREMILVLLNGWSTGVGGWGKAWAVALSALLAGAGLLTSTRPLRPRPKHKEQRTGTAGLRDHLAVLAWLVIPLLCLWLISLRQPLFTDRYLIWTAPAFYLLVAKGLTSFGSARDWSRWVVVPILGAILVASGVNLWLQGTTVIKADFRAAAAYVAAFSEEAPAREATRRGEREPAHTMYLPTIGSSSPRFDEELIIFQIPYARYTFDYYFPVHDYDRADGLYTNHRSPGGLYQMSEGQAAQQMKAITQGHNAAWLVATEVSMWDERGLVKQWLDQNAQRVTEAHFNRIDVYRYDLPSS